eukprot:6274112-Heterocapsa_arctica.AAC.1
MALLLHVGWSARRVYRVALPLDSFPQLRLTSGTTACRSRRWTSRTRYAHAWLPPREQSSWTINEAEAGR